MIVGTGWAGYEFLRRLPREHPYSITVISPRPYFVFTPLLASTCVGTLEFRVVAESVWSARERPWGFWKWLPWKAKGVQPEVHYVEGAVQGIDFDAKQVSCSSSGSKDSMIPYDRLVLACGAVTNTFGTPGVAEHALFLKDISDAKRIRMRILDCFDRATALLRAPPQSFKEEDAAGLVHFAIIGAGPTGVEFSAELHDFITQDLKKYYPEAAALARITLIDVAERILSGFDLQLAAYASERFKRNGIDIRTSVSVKQVSTDRLHLSTGEEMPVGMTLWVTGVKANPLLASLNCDMERTGVVVDERMQILRNGSPIPDAFALGDSAYLKASPLPCTAQVARQEAGYLAKSIQK